MLEPLIRMGTHFDMVLTDAQGKNCSRCLFGNNCAGCIKIHRTDEVVLLQSSDTVALSYNNVDFCYLDEIYRPELHPSMNSERTKPKLDLEECLQAFSAEEILDDNNPWYCPTCRKNQCATKKLTVWKFPDFLIIHLKRFIFIGGLSVKLEKRVEYKLSDLDLTPFMSGPLQSDVQPKFDLYACVNHYGTAGGGHYTSFCKHRPTERWNYFDDCNVVKEKTPGDNMNSDQSSAYVLFYQRKGNFLTIKKWNFKKNSSLNLKIFFKYITNLLFFAGTEHHYHLPSPATTNCQTSLDQKNISDELEISTKKLLSENRNHMAQQEQNNFTHDLVDLGIQRQT